MMCVYGVCICDMYDVYGVCVYDMHVMCMMYVCVFCLIHGTPHWSKDSFQVSVLSCLAVAACLLLFPSLCTLG